MRLSLISSLLFLLLTSMPAIGWSQVIRMDLDQAPLAGALSMLSTQAAVDIVFAHRLVEHHTVTFQYEGDDVREALHFLLEGTGLRAESVRRRQFVIVQEKAMLPELPSAPSERPRGVLSGIVMDAVSLEQLPAAHVYLPDLRHGTITNSAGFFAFGNLPAGSYRVRISYLGYKPQELMIESGVEPEPIFLEPGALHTGEIVIESRAEPVDLVTIPGMLAVPMKNLSDLPAFLGEQDLFQLLKWLPGVQQSAEAGGELVIRGGESDQNLYLLDGVPVYHPWHTFGIFSTFQTETLKDVRLYKGSFPAEYGGRLSSVVDAQMKDGNRTGLQGIVALSPISARFVLEGPINSNASFMAAARRSYLDLLLGRRQMLTSPDGGSDTLRMGYYFYDLNAKVHYRLGRWHQLSFSVYSGMDNLRVHMPFQSSFFDPESWLRQSDLAFGIGHRWGNQVTNLKHQYRYGSSFYLTSTAYRSAYRAAENTFIQPVTHTSIDSRYGVRIEDYGFKVDADYYPVLTHQLRAGIHLTHHGFSSTLDDTLRLSMGTTDIRRQESRLNAVEGSAYVQDTWQPTERWLVQPGLRASFFSSGTHYHVLPRLHARYTAHPEYLNVRGGISTQVQYLHRLRDRYSFVYDLASSRWIPASNSVKPSAAVQLALGADSNPLSWLFVSAEAFWRKSRNVLLPEDLYRSKDGLDGPGIEIGALIGQYAPAFANAYGVELSAKAERGKWQGWINYAGGRSLNRIPGNGEHGYRPARYDVPHAFQSSVRWSGSRWVVAVVGEMRSGYPYSSPIARYELGDPLENDPIVYLYRPLAYNDHLPFYARMDVSLGYRFRISRMWLNTQVHVYNISNRKNTVSRRYDPNDEVIRPIDQPGLPILPVFEINLEW